MLSGENTKNLAGLTLYGDYHDLKNLYNDVSEAMRSPVLNEDDRIINAFLYDIRHAYEGQRTLHTFHSDDDLRKVEYYGVNILWPMFMFSVAFYRWSLSFIDSSKSQQANAFRLEQIAHSLLTSADYVTGRKCIEWLQYFSGFPKNYLSQYFDECSYKYILFSDKPKTRFSNLPSILRSTFPLSEEYTQFELILNQKAKERGCSPHVLTSLDDWPEFKW